MTVTPSSFLSLLDIHERLKELFLAHQEALLKLEIELARERLRHFERELREHMRHEEEWLLPVYQRAGRIPGGAVEFFTGEHRKMLELLGRLQAALEQLASHSPDLSRQVIELFDAEAVFKQVVEHHDLREQNILYPALDRVTTEQERGELLSRCVEASRAARQD
jgi:hemerythrin-like domain-containing protein